MYADKRWDADVVTLPPERQALLDAAELIDRVGWCQHVFGTPEGQVCASMALQKAAPGVAMQAARLLSLYLYGSTTCSIPTWNDERHRTKDAVTSAMRAAAFHGWL